MELGHFSVSLAVKDIEASWTFYQALGFDALDDHRDQNWMIIKNGTTVLGLFQGMFEENVLTFNPSNVRQIQQKIKAAGYVPLQAIDEAAEGPAHFTLKDPDGNRILMDQF